MRRAMRWAMMAAALAWAGAGCGGSNNGSTDGGDGSGPVHCAEQTCAASEACVADSVCTSRPDQAAQACTEDEDHIYSCSGNADLSCHNTALCTTDGDCPSDAAGVQLVCRGGFCGIPTPDAANPTVTFRGCVDAFGIGDVTDSMRVALYRAEQNPTGASPWDAATTQDKTGCEYWGAFEFQDVPTNTPLVLKTYDPTGGFTTTYKYNLVLWSDLAVDEGGGNLVFDTRGNRLDPRTGAEIPLTPWRGYAISQTTYDIILLAVGISELPAGQGAVAGTIRDCQLREMQQVRCGFVDRPDELTYFTNAENPRPDRGRKATNVNGIYAAIGLSEGTHRMSCLAQDGAGTTVPLGEYAFRVLAGGVTILSFDWYPGVP